MFPPIYILCPGVIKMLWNVGMFNLMQYDAEHCLFPRYIDSKKCIFCYTFVYVMWMLSRQWKKKDSFKMPGRRKGSIHKWRHDICVNFDAAYPLCTLWSPKRQWGAEFQPSMHEREQKNIRRHNIHHMQTYTHPCMQIWRLFDDSG